MILAVDIGNTNIKFAIYENGVSLFFFSISTHHSRTCDEYTLLIKSFFSESRLSINKLTRVYVISVVPSITCNILACCESLKKNVFLLRESDFSSIKIKERVGVDRLAELTGARTFVKSGALLSVGIGTVTTFNLLSADNIFLGQVIAPGVKSMSLVLRSSTALLPEVQFHNKVHLLGGSLVEALESGVYWGYVSMVEGIVKRLISEFPEKIEVVLSAGRSKNIDEALCNLGRVENNLVFIGMLKVIKEI